MRQCSTQILFYVWIDYLNIKNTGTIDSRDSEERELSGLSIFQNYRLSPITNQHETVFSPKSRKISIIFLHSSITSYIKNDKIYPLAQHCQFSIFQLVNNIIVGHDCIFPSPSYKMNFVYLSVSLFQQFYQSWNTLITNVVRFLTG